VAEITARQHETPQDDSAAFTWWSWRPGISPRVALPIGLPLVFLAIFFITLGLLDLVYGISDSYASPVQVRGLALGYSMSGFSHSPQLTIRLDSPAPNSSSKATINVPVTPAMNKAIHPGDLVMLDYSPHLHNLYALQDGSSRFDIAGSSAAGNLLDTILLFLFGCLLLPYPLFLTLGGWHDLQSQPRQVTGCIVGLRAPPTRLRRSSLPGLTPRISRSWYGVALETHSSSSHERAMIFRITEDQYGSLRRHDMVEVKYSPRLQFVQSIHHITNTTYSTGMRQS